jgi:hypothetical protein
MNRTTGWLSFMTTLTLVFSVLGVLSQEVRADEARSFAITKWDGDCSGSTRNWWDDMCMAWRKKMDSKGWDIWWANFHHVKISRFADSSIHSWGADDSSGGFDHGDAALLCTHGGHDGDGWYGVMHTREHGECQTNVPQLQIGPASGGRLRFFHMSSCNSVRWDKRTTWFGPASGRVHVITGFHGLMYIGQKYVDEYSNLAKHGFSSKGVGKVWVDEMHHVDHWYNTWKTVCPIALGFGNSQSASEDALNEKYVSHWIDRSPNWMTARYKSKCDPDDGPQLPN